MSEPKPFASLGPTLLARKGGAKPAMRPQLAPISAMGGGTQAAQALAQDLEDLGWNDMGQDDEPASHQAEVFALTPSPINPEADAEARALDELARAEIFAEAEPEVARQQREIATAIAAPRRERSHRNAIDSVRRAAFTLRLDAKRHLKLRLASTVKNKSAQQLVTAALDKYLAEIPEIEALASQVKRDQGH